jgi:hypothetical protein
MFELATRTKMRFPFKGLVSVEDLWDLSTANLDSIYKTLNAQLKQAKEESLLETRSSQDKELDAKIEIVKHVVGVKLEEATQRRKALEKREQKQKIMEVMAAKQDSALHEKSVEELSRMLDELD